jgi:hypothetical protein
LPKRNRQKSPPNILFVAEKMASFLKMERGFCVLSRCTVGKSC